MQFSLLRVGFVPFRFVLFKLVLPRFVLSVWVFSAMLLTVDAVAESWQDTCVTEAFVRKLTVIDEFIFSSDGVSANNHNQCKDFPAPFVGELLFQSKYLSTSRFKDRVVKARQQQYLTQINDIRRFERYIYSLLIEYQTGNNIGAVYCIFTALYDWARHDAMLSPRRNTTGKAVRKWFLTSIVSVFTQMEANHDLPRYFDNKHVNVIKFWLYRLSVRVVSDYSYRKPQSINNHDYWAAYGVLLASITLKDQALYCWSFMKFQQGIHRIDDDGFMRNEINRGRLAMYYQNFALQPLIMMAVFFKHHQQLHTRDENLIRAAVNRLVGGVRDPSLFFVRTGHVQEFQKLLNSWNLVWLPVWRKVFSPIELGEFKGRHTEKYSSSRLGLNAGLLFQ